MASDDLTRDTHSENEINQTEDEVEELDNQGSPLTPEDKDDNFTEGADVATNLDEMHKRAFGDNDKKTITEEINGDEVAIAKDLDDSLQKSDKD